MKKEEDGEVVRIFEDLKNGGFMAFVNDGADSDALGFWLSHVAPAPIQFVEGNSRNVNNHRYYPRWIVDPVMHTGEDLSGVAYIRYRKGEEREYFFVNFGEGPETITVSVPSETDPTVYETLTGKVYPAQVLGMKNGAYTVRLTLAPNVGTALVTKV